MIPYRINRLDVLLIEFNQKVDEIVDDACVELDNFLYDLTYIKPEPISPLDFGAVADKDQRAEMARMQLEGLLGMSSHGGLGQAAAQGRLMSGADYRAMSGCGQASFGAAFGSSYNPLA